MGLSLGHHLGRRHFLVHSRQLVLCMLAACMFRKVRAAEWRAWSIGALVAVSSTWAAARKHHASRRADSQTRRLARHQVQRVRSVFASPDGRMWAARLLRWPPTLASTGGPSRAQ